MFADVKIYDFGLLDNMYKEFAPGTAPAPVEELAQQIQTVAPAVNLWQNG